MKRRPRLPRRHRAGRQGFTLMEVLLVLAILVILGTFAVTNFGRVFGNAKIRAAESQLSQFKTPLSIYQMELGSYPDSLDALRTPPPNLVDVNKWGGPYLSTDIPLDPWENPYGYKRSETGYVVFSVGPDGQEGTEDDIITQVDN